MARHMDLETALVTYLMVFTAIAGIGLLAWLLVVVANMVVEAKTDTVDLTDFGATPGRQVQTDQQAMRPAIVLRKIDE